MHVKAPFRLEYWQYIAPATINESIWRASTTELSGLGRLLEDSPAREFMDLSIESVFSTTNAITEKISPSGLLLNQKSPLHLAV
jgi:hypothetical protein